MSTEPRKERTNSHLTLVGNYKKDIYECINVVNHLRKKLKNLMPTGLGMGTFSHHLFRMYEKGYQQALSEGNHPSRKPNETIRNKLVRAAVETQFPGDGVQILEDFIESIEIKDEAATVKYESDVAKYITDTAHIEEPEDNGRPKSKRSRAS